MATTLITGGTVVSATGRSEADVLIDGEKIVALLAPGSVLLGTDLTASADTVIDATGKYVIPGGIDAHTHFELPFGDTEASDSFESRALSRSSCSGMLCCPPSTSTINFSRMQTKSTIKPSRGDCRLK